MAFNFTFAKQYFTFVKWTFTFAKQHFTLAKRHFVFAKGHFTFSKQHFTFAKQERVSLLGFHKGGLVETQGHHSRPQTIDCKRSIKKISFYARIFKEPTKRRVMKRRIKSKPLPPILMTTPNFLILLTFP